MKSLYLRIWLTVVAVLALFAVTSGWLLQRHLEHERQRAETLMSERMAAWGDLIQNSIPGPTALADDQASALREWSRRLRVPLALHDAQGERIGASDSYLRREAEGPNSPRRPFSIHLEDGRTLWLMRPNMLRFPRGEAGSDGARPATATATMAGAGAASGPPTPAGAPGEPAELPPVPMSLPEEVAAPESLIALGGAGAVPSLGTGPEGQPEPSPSGMRWSIPLPFKLPDLPASLGLAVLLPLLFLAVAGGAYPVVRRLTRRLEQLKLGVEAFGAGALDQRVTTDGQDEVAALAKSFNRAAGRIEALVKSNQSLLANASHELRSPLARLKMAVTMLDDAPPAMQARLRREIDTNIGELDALVEEVLLSSRLDSGATHDLAEQVDLAGVVAEEAARVGAELSATPSGAGLRVRGSERLLRRAARNLLENARRYGGGQIDVELIGDDATGGTKVVTKVGMKGAGAHDMAGDVTLDATGPAGLVRLQVCDRGPGVPVAERERIFEPFYRLPGHAEREGGVGLGLALVRQIAVAHHGQVVCEPRAGGGSCFVFTLPRAGPIPPAAT